MSATTIQPRKPAGTPVGGQWSGLDRLPPEVSLLESEPCFDLDQEVAAFGDGEPEAAEDEDFEEPGPRVYDMAAFRADIAQKKVDTANRRLEKAGIEERFEATFEPYSVTRQNPDTGLLETFDRVRLTLNRPTIAYDGFTFAARIDTTESGKIMALSAPGVELDGWRPESLACEHCGTTRQRKNLYAVKGADGQYKVIGSSCLATYTGIEPKGLWALTWDDLDEFEQEDDFETGGGWGHGYTVAPTTDVLKVAAGAIAVQGGYQAAYKSAPTTALVRMALFPPADLKKEDRDLVDEVWAAAKDVDAESLAAEIREAMADQDGDWAENVLTLLEEEHVGYKHSALLASGLSSVERMRAKKREKATIAKGFVAPVGEKITGTRATVLKLREHTSYFGYSERTTQMVRMQAEDGHIITWWASSPTALKEGVEVTIDRATVKKHETYNDEDQTVVTRAKLTPIAD